VADYGDEGWGGQLQEGGGGDGGGEGADVFLAVLWAQLVWNTLFLCNGLGERRTWIGRTYSAEEMPYEYDQYPSRDIRTCI
jgi:hypothetical protein